MAALCLEAGGMIICGLIAANWKWLLSTETVVRHAWLFTSITELNEDVFAYNMVFGSCVYLLARSIFARWLSVVLASSVVIGFAAVSLTKFKHVALPLLPWDLWFAPDSAFLFQIAGSSAQEPDKRVTAVLVALVAVVFIAVRRRLPVVRRGLGVGIALGIVSPTFWIYGNFEDLGKRFFTSGVHNISWDQSANFQNYGPFYTFFSNLSFVAIARPSDHLLEAAKAVDELSLENSTQSGRLPDVVTILSESFTDLPERIFDQKFSCLPAEKMSKLITPAWGGYTANVEFELLTGYPHAIFPQGSVPYQMYLNKPLEQSLPNQFKGAGYDVSALHTFNRAFFSRPLAYRMLGFDRYDGLEDLTLPAYAGQYVSDQVLFDEIKKKLDKNDSIPHFIHAVSMMAHLPYSWKGRFSVPPQLVYSLPPTLKQHRLPLTQYSAMIFEHERMLCTFLNGLKNRTRQTIVLFYGDHYPSFGSMQTYYDIHAYLHPNGSVPFDLRRNYSKTPVFMFDSRTGFVPLPNEVPTYNLGTILQQYVGIKVAKIWAMSHKLDNRVLTQGIYVAEQQNSRFLGETQSASGSDEELNVIKAHAYIHMLSKRDKN